MTTVSKALSDTPPTLVKAGEAHCTPATVIGSVRASKGTCSCPLQDPDLVISSAQKALSQDTLAYLTLTHVILQKSVPKRSLP